MSKAGKAPEEELVVAEPPPAPTFEEIVTKWAAETEACAPALHHLGYKEHVQSQLPALVAALEAR